MSCCKLIFATKHHLDNDSFIKLRYKILCKDLPAFLFLLSLAILKVQINLVMRVLMDDEVESHQVMSVNYLWMMKYVKYEHTPSITSKGNGEGQREAPKFGNLPEVYNNRTWWSGLLLWIPSFLSTLVSLVSSLCAFPSSSLLLF